MGIKPETAQECWLVVGIKAISKDVLPWLISSYCNHTRLEKAANVICKLTKAAGGILGFYRRLFARSSHAARDRREFGLQNY